MPTSVLVAGRRHITQPVDNNNNNNNNNGADCLIIPLLSSVALAVRHGKVLAWNIRLEAHQTFPVSRTIREEQNPHHSRFCRHQDALLYAASTLAGGQAKCMTLTLAVGWKRGGVRHQVLGKNPGWAMQHANAYGHCVGTLLDTPGPLPTSCHMPY